MDINKNGEEMVESFEKDLDQIASKVDADGPLEFGPKESRYENFDSA